MSAPSASAAQCNRIHIVRIIPHERRSPYGERPAISGGDRQAKLITNGPPRRDGGQSMLDRFRGEAQGDPGARSLDPRAAGRRQFAEPTRDLVQRPPFLVRLHREWRLDLGARRMVGQTRSTGLSSGL